MNAGMRQVLSRIADIIDPPPTDSIIEWAEERFFVPDGPRPGLWSASSAPFLIEPLTRLDDRDPCDLVVLQFAAQVGKTLTGLIWMARSIQVQPDQFILVQPSLFTAAAFSRDRVDPIIKKNGWLKELIPKPKSRDAANTTRHKRYPGGSLRLASAAAGSELRGTPARRVFCDETDAYPLDLGGLQDGEGDPVELALGRAAAFGDRGKALAVSTPTRKRKSRIARLYRTSDRNRFFVPCPHCGEFQRLRWAQVKWPQDQPHAAYYACEHNGCVIDNADKATMIPAGQWRPENQGAQGGRVRGYQLSSLYVMPGMGFGWGKLATMWVDIHREEDPVMRKVRLKSFINIRLGEVWRDDQEDIDHNDIASRRADFWHDYEPRLGAPRESGAALPSDVLLITGGVDVQGDRIEHAVWGWGRGFRSWLLDYWVGYGDTTLLHGGVWDDLRDRLDELFAHAGGGELHAVATAIDYGHNPDTVWAFCEPLFRRRRVWPVKGGGADVPIWPRMASRSKKAGKARNRVFSIGEIRAKGHIYDRLPVAEDSAGFVRFPHHLWSGPELTHDWFEQLTVEERRVGMRRGKSQVLFVCPPGRRNEAIDTAAYAYAALNGLMQNRGKSLDELLAESADSLGVEYQRQGPPPARRRSRRLRPGTLNGGIRRGHSPPNRHR